MTTNASNTPTAVVAKPPFDIRDADVVVRTSDNVDFYLGKLILSVASPFFQDMFSLSPAPTTSRSVKLESILITEDSETFDHLMRFVYPIRDPMIPSLDRLEQVLGAAVKYDMTETVELVLHAIRRQFDQTQPQEVYAIACLFEQEEDAAHAARMCFQQLRSPSKDVPFESAMAGVTFTRRMRHISAGAYYRLFQYLRDPQSQAVRFTDGRPAQGPGPQAPTAMNVDLTPPSGRDSIIWYYGDIADADANLISTDREVFPVHSLVLRLAFASKLLDGPRDLSGAISAGLDSSTLSRILNLCYPHPSFVVTSFASLLQIYRAACLFEIHPVLHAVRRGFIDLVDQCPNLMTMYLIAVEQGWPTEAQAIARVIADRGQEYMYAPEMDSSSVSALAYYRLLKYCHAYGQMKSSVIKRYAPSIARRKEGVLLSLRLYPSNPTGHLFARYRSASGYNPEYNLSLWLDPRGQLADGLKTELSRVQLEFGPLPDEQDTTEPGA